MTTGVVAEPTFESDPAALASTHRDLERARPRLKNQLAPQALARALESTHRRLIAKQAKDPVVGKATEWFLDNYYVVRRAARQVEEELPRGFLLRLPELASGKRKGKTRVREVARALVEATAAGFDAEVLTRFITDYQAVAPLTIAELWALPTLLRHAVLGRLVRILKDVVTTQALAAASPLGDPSVGVERCIRALRLLADMDWKVFFEKESLVEKTLRDDPSSVYVRMDFATCDAYRKAVEELAWGAHAGEVDVASRAITMARAGAPDQRRGHVGYYLMDEGRATLEREVGYRAAGRERLRRAARSRPALTYFLALGLATLVPVLGVGAYVAMAGSGVLTTAVAVVVSLVPASILAVSFVQWALTSLLSPRSPPKLDFGKGIPEDARTLVVMPTLLGSESDVTAMLHRIELHFLANPDPHLGFALLCDEVDSDAMPESSELLDRAIAGVERLNHEHGTGGNEPFHLLYRTPKWNDAESCFMGWERKRGKLAELNRVLRGDKTTSYSRHLGQPAGLVGIRYVLTVDADTELPIGTARRLVGVMEHPLNRAVLDADTRRITAGFAIAQPRVEISTQSARDTWFARIFAGDVGFDIYTHAASNLYQDLFGTGIYVGKGIYDVDAFTGSLEGRVPENAVASHDLLEGTHARTTLVSDVVLFEQYPSHYLGFARRMHRWLRGDWQLLPWLRGTVPSERGERERNPLAMIDRWKIVDNLRRSLGAPLMLVFLLVGWSRVPDSPWVVTCVAMLILLAPVLPGLVQDPRSRRENLARYALALVFLAEEAAIATDAIVRVLARLLFTRRYLLQWTSAAHTANGLRGRATHAFFFREMWASVAMTVATAALLAVVRPAALGAAAPFLLLWLAAPEIARRLSEPVGSRMPPLQPSERRALRMLARRTWLFFETFVEPNNQWLPVDNHQEEPHEQTARRTSPTNIGMMLLSVMSAYDLGYIGASELSQRLRSSFASIARLTRYQGHLLNWYETQSSEPLLPRYVSTVDSGNYIGCLLALARGCEDVARAPVLRGESWKGLADSVALLVEVLRGVPEEETAPLRAIAARMLDAFDAAESDPGSAYTALRMITDTISPEVDRALFALLGAGALKHESGALLALRTWVDRIRHQLDELRRELELFLPWFTQPDLPSGLVAALGEPSTSVPLCEIPELARKLTAVLDQWAGAQRARGELSAEHSGTTARARAAFEAAGENAQRLGDELAALASSARADARGADFRLLFDRERRLFRIGYNVTLDQLDAHHYDLLASEARLASYLAIVHGQVPEAHWGALGRPMTRVTGAPALLSWGGTMFEYLMPPLLMRSHEGTLLAQSCELAVKAQIDYGAHRGVPWGISESAYGRVDPNQTYQYRSFGVPALGFQRGLGDELVIAPYASMLAVSIAPHAVAKNLAELESRGMMGTYGLYEALDFRADAEPSGSLGNQPTVVRSYMAHHQGMILVALNNFFHTGVMNDRFHTDRSVETGERLLNERAPDVAPSEWPHTDDDEEDTQSSTPVPGDAPQPWSPAATGRPQATLLSNGRLTSVLTDSGGGGLTWKGLELTSFSPDASCDGDGTWIYLRDEATGQVWRATSSGRTTYSVHKVEYHRREFGISVHVDVVVAGADDVEIRQVTLRNETDQPRRITVTTASLPVLLPVGQSRRHPAFGKLFVETDVVAGLHGLLAARRPRSPKDGRAVMVQCLVHEGKAVRLAGYETDRTTFQGRCEDPSSPLSLALGRASVRGQTGAMIDPVMSLTASVELKPKATVTLAFVTAVGRSRGTVLDLGRRYGTMHAIRWAFRDAETDALRRVAHADLAPTLMPHVQRLFSSLLLPDSNLRAAPEILAQGKACKEKLWGRGISGDDPILLVRVHDPTSPLLRETIAAQRWLRLSGVRTDLVLLDEQPSSYLQNGDGTLRAALRELDVLDLLNLHGGIYTIATDQLSAEECMRLAASARVVLDTRDGSLEARFARPLNVKPSLPRFEGSVAAQVDARPVKKPKLLFDNGIGGFTEDGREYVLVVGQGKTTPAPWCNVLANAEAGCIVSESSLGATWSLNAGENRLTPWRNDPVADVPSEALYLRDEATAAVWSPTPLPAGKDADTLVRHGAGYTTYTRESHGLVQELLVFVPRDAPIKIARLTLKNTRPMHRRITATYYAEWVLGSMREDQAPHIVPELEREAACLLASTSWNEELSGRVAFLAAERAVHGVTTDRSEFVGRSGNYEKPQALERWGLSGRVEAGADPCAALQVHLELAPGEEIVTHFTLGQERDRESALRVAARFRDGASVTEAFRALCTYWDNLLGTVRVKTPEPAMDVLLNRWLLYQTLSGRILGRTGFYQSSGAFGYRDQLQDVLALLHAAPDHTRAHILEAARHQFEEGDALHWWHPPAGRGVRTHCSDDFLWLPYVTEEYVRRTGDVSILKEELPFLTGKPLGHDEQDRYAQFPASAKSASLLEHCRRAVLRGLTEGAHGLPLMGDGDWNDGMSKVGAEGRGESVWLGWFLHATIERFASLCDLVGEQAEAGTWRERAAVRRTKIEACAWDGDWYLRAFHDDGSKLGSASDLECRIDTIAQSWAVLSGAGEPERARRAVASADRELVREKDGLVLLLTPPFDRTPHDPGYIRAYPPGVRENGGQYTHAATWLGWAWAALGDGERATRIFRLLNPILKMAKAEDVARYRVEPYVLAGDVYGHAPWVGRGGWTWYTGAAGWDYRLGVEAILGLRREGERGLRVEPCIPPTWTGFEAWVRIGAQELHVVVENPEGVSSGVRTVSVDGASSANLIDVAAGATGTREVRVVLGKPSP